jgi:hypothetical protein
MVTVVTSVVSYVLGFASGWATRSISNSPQGVAVKLLEVAHNAKERFERWTSLERERFEDMMAAARAGAGQDVPHGEPSDNHQQKERASGHEPHASEAPEA